MTVAKSTILAGVFLFCRPRRGRRMVGRVPARRRAEQYPGMHCGRPAIHPGAYIHLEEWSGRAHVAWVASIRS